MDNYAKWPFIDHAVIQEWKQGDLIHVWTQNSGIFYVLEGTVHVARLLDTGERSVLHIVGKNSYFFENRYFHPAKRISVAYAVCDAKTAYLSPEHIEELLKSSLEFCHNLMFSMSLKNLNSGKLIVDSFHQNTKFNVLSALYELWVKGGLKSGNRLNVTQVTIAEYVGKHPVTVNRVLKVLEKEGYVKLGRNFILLEVDKIVEELKRQSEYAYLPGQKQ